MTPRTNPFRADRLDALPYLLKGATWHEILSRLEKQNFRGAVIGPHGHGKSTFLQSIAPLLEGRGWNIHHLQLNSTNRDFSKEVWREFLPALGARDFLLLDGAEQLSIWKWKRFLRCVHPASGVLLSAHRPGLLPTIWQCRSSSQLLQSLVFQLDPNFQIAPELAELFIKRHNGNVRDALREIYDLQE